MRQVRNHLLFLVLAAIMLGCTGNGTHSDEGGGAGRAPQPSDTLYTQAAAMEAFAFDPDRALLIIDSAEIVGNLSDFGADLLRAKVYSWTFEEMNRDSAILIGERLIQHDSVKTNPYRKEGVFELLLNACRLRKDDEQALHWAMQLGELYLSQGEKTEALRNDAEIGTLLIRIGQQEEGLAKIDSVIHQLGGKRKFNELDALIIALKRKAEICNELGLYDEMIPVAQHMLDLLDDYEQHPSAFHDGNIREPADEDRPDYIDFYRGKAYSYLAAAYSSLELANARVKVREYLALYEQTSAAQSVSGRFMIAPTLGKIGEYDRMLAIYDEVEQQLGDDTLNANYVEILHGRAEAAEAQGRPIEAIDYWKRHDALNELLATRLLQGKAHLYAARFRVSEQQREIERHREAMRRATMIGTTIGIVGLLVLLFALYAIAQWRKTQHHNRILAQQITEAVEYKEKYKELKRSVKADVSGGFVIGSGGFAIRPKGEGDFKSPTHSSWISNPAEPMKSSTSDLAELSDVDLFIYLRDLIERERLFLNPSFERQTLISLTGLSKERIGAAFSQGSGHERLTTLVREMRLDYAVRLMNEQPKLTIEQVCQASGFSSADTFSRNFRAKYGMTPTAYRGTLG